MICNGRELVVGAGVLKERRLTTHRMPTFSYSTSEVAGRTKGYTRGGRERAGILHLELEKTL